MLNATQIAIGDCSTWKVSVDFGKVSNDFGKEKGDFGICST